MEVYSLCRDWTFWLDDTGSTELDRDRAVWQPVPIPHDWMIWSTRGFYADGTGWYRRVLSGEEMERAFHVKHPGDRTALFFEGAYMDTAVFVNGTLAGEWKYGYTSFHFDVTDLLTGGENEVLVRCVLRHPNSRWYAGAGLYRPVELWRMPATHLVPQGLYVAARERLNGSWTVAASAEIGLWEPEDVHDCKVEFRVLDREGHRLARRREWAEDAAVLAEEETETYARGEKVIGSVSVELELPTAHRWDLGDGYCYRLEVSLLRDGQEVDALSTAFGCRTVELEPEEGLLLNHRKVVLHGAGMHHDLGCLGTAFNRCAARRQLEILRDMGVNAIRTGHTVPARELLELTDEMGMLVVDESFDCWYRGKNRYDYGRFFADWHRRDIAAWVRRDRNHPSVLLWSIGNEIYDTHADGKKGAAITKELMEEVLVHDPLGNALPTFASNYLPWENTQRAADVIKVVGYNYGERIYAQHHAAHPDWVIYGSETGSIVQSRGVYHFPRSKPLLVDDDLQCSSLGNSRTSWGAPDIDFCLNADRENPFTLGQFIWTGFDYIGEPTPYHTKSSYFGQVDTAGFPKDSYYHYQAGWTDWRQKPMVHVFPYWDFNEGQMIDVCAVSNAPAVELWVNGVSQGRRELPENGPTRCAVWQVPYCPGSLRAAAYDGDGNVIAEDVESSFGDAAALALACDRTSLVGDGKDLAFLTVTALDRDGREVKNANNRITVTVGGSGQLLGLDNGDSADFEPYKTTSRRLFSGKLLAVVAGGKGQGPVTVEVTSPGLAPARLTLKAEPFDGEAVLHPALLPPVTDDTVPVRKIELTARRRELTAEEPSVEVTASVRPEGAGDYPLEWRLTDDGGVTVPYAKLEMLDGRRVRVTGLGDGPFRVRCGCANGGDHLQVLSQLEMNVTGMGRMYPDPYGFISGSLYGPSFGDVGNGNERGVSMSRTGQSWVAYEHLDFGPGGSDTVTIPIFELAGAATPIRFWRGVPYAEGSRMIGERVYHKPTRWNVYNPETFTLDEKLTGVETFGIELQSKVHIKGFTFHRASRAWDTLAAAECDMIYGDSYQKSAGGVLDIGNNVSLVFRGLDFGQAGCRGIVIRGRTGLENNSIHICFSRDGAEQRRIVEFTKQEDWGEQTFALEPVRGVQDVTFLFLPGSRFDFKDFRFRPGAEEKEP